MDGYVGRGLSASHKSLSRKGHSEVAKLGHNSQESHQFSPVLVLVLASGPLLPPGGDRRLDLLLDQAHQELQVKKEMEVMTWSWCCVVIVRRVSGRKFYKMTTDKAHFNCQLNCVSSSELG